MRSNSELSIDKICSNCYTPSPTPHPHPHPHPHRHPHPQKHLIGGCKGTRYGCCPDSNNACSDLDCSNCL